MINFKKIYRYPPKKKKIYRYDIRNYEKMPFYMLRVPIRKKNHVSAA